MSLVKPFAVLALAICSGLLLAGCQPSAAKAPKQPTLTAMVVTPGSANVTVGATQALNVTGGFSNGSTMNLTSTSTFASSAPTVATVSGEAFYYISQRAERPIAFMPQESVDQRVIAVYFDRNRRVERLANYGLKDGKIFDFVSRTTPTSGREVNYLGNFFQFFDFKL